jgi:acetate kinase
LCQLGASVCFAPSPTSKRPDECIGLILDPRANDADGGSARRISASGARPAAFVIPTDEESEIARGTVQALRR